MVLKNKKLSVKTTPKTSKPKQVIGKLLTPLFALGRYFKESWQELLLVRWPNRRATWGLTAAVILFTAMFVALIVSLDAIFDQLFNLIIK